MLWQAAQEARIAADAAEAELAAEREARQCEAVERSALAAQLVQLQVSLQPCDVQIHHDSFLLVL